jgi:hypothetical protein
VELGVEGHLTEFVPARNRAVVALDVRWPGDDEAKRFYQVVTMRRGKILHIQGHDSRRSAAASVGLSQARASSLSQ